MERGRRGGAGGGQRGECSVVESSVAPSKTGALYG